MANFRCKPEDLDKVIKEILDDYSYNFTEATNKAIRAVANVAKEEVKAKSPVGKYTKKKGRYQKGWAVREEAVNRFHNKDIIHNRTDYQLAHLLEKGHVLIRGGREKGRVSAQVHIAPAEEHAIKNFEEAIVKIAEGRGS